MTIFAVMCAGMFPLIHMGRPWLAYLAASRIPNQRGLWANFRSPAASGTCSRSAPTSRVSLLFWYIGLVPDLASLRDRATTSIRKLVYGIARLGWRGRARHWQHYEKAYMLLAGLATRLVLSVHSVVSLRLRRLHPSRLAHDDLPALLRGGRHLRRLRHGGHGADRGRARPWTCKNLITIYHLEVMNKIILA